MAHIHELFDFVVNAFIVYEDTVLLVDHKKAGIWLPLGGHIELNEDPQEALFREIQEESGLNSSDLIVLSDKLVFPDSQATGLYTPNFIDTHAITDSHTHIALNYFVLSHSNEVVLAVAEHAAITWHTLETIQDPDFRTVSSVRVYAQKALEAAHVF